MPHLAVHIIPVTPTQQVSIKAVVTWMRMQQTIPTVFQSENGNMMDIDITAAYTGSNKNGDDLRCVTEDTSPESYDGGGPNPHHVFGNGSSMGLEMRLNLSR